MTEVQASDATIPQQPLDGDVGERGGVRHPMLTRHVRSGRSGRAWRLITGANLAVPVAALVLSSLALWVASLPHVAVAKIDGWGLLPALPLTWYVGFGLAVVGLGVVLNARAPGRTAVVAALGSIFLELFATTSIVYDVPRYPWTYKHIGVTEYLLTHRVPAVEVDIYQNFPGFFYVAGLFHILTHVSVMTMARYAEVTAHALNAVALYWALGALSRNNRVRAWSVAVFTLTNWVGQTYFAPQAAAFPVALFVIGAFLRIVAQGHGRPAKSSPASRLHRGSSLWGSPQGYVLCAAAFTFIAVSHQFTPVAVLVQMAALAIIFRLRFPWLLGLFAVIEARWVWQALPYISRHFSLFNPPSYNNARPPPALKPVLAGADLMAQVPHVLTFLVVVGTVAAVVLAGVRRRGVEVLVVGALLLAPSAIIVVQPYGQEGILRCYLFGLPWCSYLIVRHLLRVERVVFDRVARVVASAVLAVLSFLAVPSFFGNEMINHIYPSDVSTDQWFEKNTAAGSELLLMTSAFPTRSSDAYDQHVLIDDPLDPWLLREVPGFTEASTSGQALADFTRRYAKSQAASHVIYLALGPTQEEYIRLYGLMTPQIYQDYLGALERDRYFHLVHVEGSSYLFKAG